MTQHSQARAAVLAHPGVHRVRKALAAHQISAEVTVLDGPARSAAEAAAYLGISAAQIANSLVFAARAALGSPADPLLVLTSGAHRVDTVKVADLLELASVGRADAKFVRSRTGFVIGGVAPMGHTHPVRTLIDVSLARYDTVWAVAGHPHAVFPTTYDELLRMSGGQPIEVT
jgi:prolyl-tRNA editing enzyme YbaK/EbsC (Cys-tRNA(Pro) deacylase)